jgi:hypothetical protein
MTREERARRMRPLVKEAVDRTSFRAVAEEIGLSHNAVYRFVEQGETPYERTLRKYEEWAAQTDYEMNTDRTVSTDGGSGDDLHDLREQVSQILSLEIDGHLKAQLLQELAAAKRSNAAEVEARAADRRAEAAVLEARMAAARAEALRLALEAAPHEKGASGPRAGHFREAGEAEDLAMQVVQRKEKERTQRDKARRGKQAG